ncbi:MAG: lysophospholipid acyltransferase family protein [Candidatus Baltobacteraceae bacterium]
MTAYDIGKAVCSAVLRVWRLRASGTANVPLDGPLIIACNHASYLDPPALGVACPRPIRYMAKAELFAIPLLGSMISAFGTYPVDRHRSATAAIKRSVEILRAGGCIGIFPEGTRNASGSATAREGVALLASLGKAPVVPAYIAGSDRARRLHQIKVAFGPALRFPGDRKASRDSLAKFTEQIMGEIHSLAESIDGN